MRRLQELSRQRLVGWMGANPKITQTTIAIAVGVTQGWVSRYKSGEQEADLDQLAAMASVFGHTINELIDVRPDPKEQVLIDAFRAMPLEKRDLAIRMLEAMIPVVREPAANHERHKRRP